MTPGLVNPYLEPLPLLLAQAAHSADLVGQRLPDLLQPALLGLELVRTPGAEPLDAALEAGARVCDGAIRPRADAVLRKLRHLEDPAEFQLLALLLRRPELRGVQQGRALEVAFLVCERL